MLIVKNGTLTTALTRHPDESRYISMLTAIGIRTEESISLVCHPLDGTGWSEPSRPLEQVIHISSTLGNFSTELKSCSFCC
jgi:hypothetical protein